MASTLKPFRQYSEHEVLNIFSYTYDGSNDPMGTNCTNMIADGGDHTWDAGRLLIASHATMKASGGDWDPVTQNVGTRKGSAGDASGALTAWGTALKGYLGANYNAGANGFTGSPDGSHVGLFGNSNATLTAVAAGLTASDSAVGIALRSTLAYDENNEKLLYYRQKADELQAVLPGDAVPCLRRGLIAMKVGGTPAVGANVYGAAASGTAGGTVTQATPSGSPLVIGEIVAIMDVDNDVCLVQIDV